MKNKIVIMALVFALALVGCKNARQETNNNGEYVVCLRDDIRVEVLSNVSSGDSETDTVIEFETSEGPNSVFVELWVRPNEEAQWDLLVNETLFISEHIDGTIPAGCQYMVYVSKVDGNNGNITLDIEKS